MEILSYCTEKHKKNPAAHRGDGEILLFVHIVKDAFSFLSKPQQFPGQSLDEVLVVFLFQIGAQGIIFLLLLGKSLVKGGFLSAHIGEEFDARISSVTGFGLFAELENTCEGLIPLLELPGGIWIFDDGTLSVRQGRDLLTVGDRIEVRVEEADIARGKVRFSLVSIAADEA